MDVSISIEETFATGIHGYTLCRRWSLKPEQTMEATSRLEKAFAPTLSLEKITKDDQIQCREHRGHPDAAPLPLHHHHLGHPHQCLACQHLGFLLRSPRECEPYPTMQHYNLQYQAIRCNTIHYNTKPYDATPFLTIPDRTTNTRTQRAMASITQLYHIYNVSKEQPARMRCP